MPQCGQTVAVGARSAPQTEQPCAVEDATDAMFRPHEEQTAASAGSDSPHRGQVICHAAPPHKHPYQSCVPILSGTIQPHAEQHIYYRASIGGSEACFNRTRISTILVDLVRWLRDCARAQPSAEEGMPEKEHTGGHHNGGHGPASEGEPTADAVLAHDFAVARQQHQENQGYWSA